MLITVLIAVGLVLLLLLLFAVSAYRKIVKRAEAKAEESERLKMAFLANMSHEVRTPLNAIIGFSELLMDTEDSEERSQYMDIVKKNNVVLLRLIEDILDLSKIESGIVDYKPMQFDFIDNFRSIYNLWLDRNIYSDVDLMMEAEKESLLVNMDTKILNKILNNYLSNAFKYTHKGSITMGYEEIESGIRVYVKDTGIGIPEGKQTQVFSKFNKVDDFAQGTGIGLSICKDLMDACAGEVGFSSIVGEGSEFWAFFPFTNEIN